VRHRMCLYIRAPPFPCRSKTPASRAAGPRSRDAIRARGAELGFTFDMEKRAREYTTHSMRNRPACIGRRARESKRRLKGALFLTAYLQRGPKSERPCLFWWMSPGRSVSMAARCSAKYSTPMSMRPEVRAPPNSSIPVAAINAVPVGDHQRPAI